MNVIYTRISNEEQSSSIENQIKICQEYAINNNILIDKIYIDDGVSGTHFNRPDFKRLLEEINENKISTIIVKDLSRIGRCFIDTSFFLEKVCAKKNIKLISVNDQISKLNPEDDILIPIKNYLNELYVKECRRKRLKYIEEVKNKKVLSNKGVYGYTFTNDQIIIDKTAADAIKIVFDMYLKDFKIKNIITYLNIKHYVVPGYKKKSYKVLETSKYNWQPFMIYRILNTIEYTGCASNLKTVKVKQHRIKNNNPIVIDNKYPLIISKEQYQLVQLKLLSRRNVNKRRYTNDNIYCELLDVDLVILNDFKLILDIFMKELIDEYKKHKIAKMRYFKRINIFEKQIEKELNQEDYNSYAIKSYNEQINNLKLGLEREVNGFSDFFKNIDDLYLLLKEFLVSNIEVIYTNQKYKVRILYFFT